MKRVSHFYQSKCWVGHFKIQSCNTCMATSPEISFPGKENLTTWVGIEPTHSIINELGLMASASSQEPQWQHHHHQECSIRESHFLNFKVHKNVAKIWSFCYCELFTYQSRSLNDSSIIVRINAEENLMMPTHLYLTFHTHTIRLSPQLSCHYFHIPGLEPVAHTPLSFRFFTHFTALR